MDRRDFCNLGIISTIGLVLPTRSLADNSSYLSDDVYLDEMDTERFTLVRNRINRVKYIVGYANFNILSFDDMIKVAKSYSKVGKFCLEKVGKQLNYINLRGEIFLATVLDFKLANSTKCQLVKYVSGNCINGYVIGVSQDADTWR